MWHIPPFQLHYVFLGVWYVPRHHALHSSPEDPIADRPVYFFSIPDVQRHLGGNDRDGLAPDPRPAQERRQRRGRARRAAAADVPRVARLSGYASPRRRQSACVYN